MTCAPRRTLPLLPCRPVRACRAICPALPPPCSDAQVTAMRGSKGQAVLSVLLEAPLAPATALPPHAPASSPPATTTATTATATTTSNPAPAPAPPDPATGRTRGRTGRARAAAQARTPPTPVAASNAAPASTDAHASPAAPATTTTIATATTTTISVQLFKAGGFYALMGLREMQSELGLGTRGARVTLKASIEAVDGGGCMRGLGVWCERWREVGVPACGVGGMGVERSWRGLPWMRLVCERPCGAYRSSAAPILMIAHTTRTPVCRSCGRRLPQVVQQARGQRGSGAPAGPGLAHHGRRGGAAAAVLCGGRRWRSRPQQQ